MTLIWIVVIWLVFMVLFGEKAGDVIGALLTILIVAAICLIPVVGLIALAVCYPPLAVGLGCATVVGLLFGLCRLLLTAFPGLAKVGAWTGLLAVPSVLIALVVFAGPIGWVVTCWAVVGIFCMFAKPRRAKL